MLGSIFSDKLQIWSSTEFIGTSIRFVGKIELNCKDYGDKARRYFFDVNHSFDSRYKTITNYFYFKDEIKTLTKIKEIRERIQHEW